ncbi:bifunctional folylpolyglutamate synthase/dihydrofolate synthase [Tumebacillus flagellatus]|uniref:tetrahydrofolate synthase n=1 Tax=Tumebacillus flagellatus TaxID=1157490 RepID=A0A074LKP1_9BACL|nr:folylpolyglutamate synthase/dihydrofolate synthase family protein [Tumebacillus flagellatus]KEO82701.1 hypothetical protein EL26_14135 [Tumebacillus flagellatus]
MKGTEHELPAASASPEGFETVDAVFAWIHGFDRFDGRKGIKPGLQRMEAMLSRLGNPHRELKFLHVAGTNGKGSTCAYLASILEEAGYRVGLFTSPYMTSFHDRMSVGGLNITDEELLAMGNLLRPAVEEVTETEHGRPTEFEVVTALSILHYSRVGVDVVVWETGLGGRLDSTNVVTPVLSLITNVGRDHQAILGETLEEIAAEKAGIIKPGVPVLTTAAEPALSVILRTASEKSAPSLHMGRDFWATGRKALGLEGQMFDWQGEATSAIASPIDRIAGASSANDLHVDSSSAVASQVDASNANVGPARDRVVFSELRIGMLGPHQVWNASLAVAAIVQLNAMGWNISEGALRRGLQRMRWAGRFEVVSQEPLTILDGAHNPEGAEMLSKTISELLPNTRLAVVFGILADKAIPGVLAPVLAHAAHVIVTRADYPRAANPQDVAVVVRDLAPHLPSDVCDTVPTALARAQELAVGGQVDAVLYTGSLYTISEVRHFLFQK